MKLREGDIVVPNCIITSPWAELLRKEKKRIPKTKRGRALRKIRRVKDHRTGIKIKVIYHDRSLSK